MAPAEIVTGALAQIEDALADAVERARAADPLAPVTVLVGHVLLRPYLRRMLAARSIAQLNVNFLQPHELAEQLSPADAAPRQALSPGANRLLVREIAASAQGYFAGVAGREGFAEALGRLFRELELGGFSAVGFARAAADVSQGPSANAAKLDELARLYGDYQRRRAPFATHAERFEGADPAHMDGPLLLFGLWSPPELQLRMIERIAAAATVTAFLPRAGIAADDPVAPLRQRLLAAGAGVTDLPVVDAASPGERVARAIFRGPGQPAVDAGDVALVSAPDTVREVWEAARACLHWARDGMRFHEMAVVYRNREPYRALVDEIFSEAGIETYLHDGRLLSDHPLGRRLLALLDLAADAKFSRAKVMEFLTETRVSGEAAAAHGFRPSEWETYTREAGVVEGREQWDERLSRLAREKREAAHAEGYEWLRDHADRVDALRAFVAEFHRALASRADEAPWDEHIDWLARIAATYACGTEPLIDALRDLKALGEVTRLATFAIFCRAVRDDLESRDSTAVLKEPIRLFGRRGVAVMDASSLRHLRFRAVHMLGVAERAWPPPRRPDPLLLEDERRAVNAAGAGVLPLRTEPDDQPLEFWLGLQSAREQLAVSYARSDSGGSGKHLPSYFFRAVADALAGRRIDLGEIEGSGVVRRIAAGRLASDDLESAVTHAEYDRGLVRAALEGVEPAGVAALMRTTGTFARAIDARRQRWGHALTAHDGVMLSDEAIAAARGRSDFAAGRAVSPSRMETYATCPYQYFLQYVLRIQPVEEPEKVERIDALERGSLIHAILERFLRAVGREDPPGSARREAHLAMLDEAFEVESADRVARGVTGRPLIWEMDRRQISEDLVRWYDAEVRDSGALLPGAQEVRFGPAHGGYGVEDPLSSDVPLRLNVGARELLFQGRIDRVDWDDGRRIFRVIDYKTGRPRDKSAFDHGRALQLPVYLRAAAGLLGIGHLRGEAQYFYVSSRGNFVRRTLTGEDLEARAAEFEQVLETIAGGVDGGMFAPAPEPNSICKWCDYRAVCDARIDVVMQRKQDDPRAAAYRAMGEIK